MISAGKRSNGDMTGLDVLIEGDEFVRLRRGGDSGTSPQERPPSPLLEQLGAGRLPDPVPVVAGNLW
jgi:hypothetical protein